MIRSAIILSAALILTGPASAGEFNRKISVGDAAPVWQDLPGTDGKKHSLSDVKAKDVVVVVVTCNHCPVADSYVDRLIDFTKKYAAADSKVAVVAINVSTYDTDKLPKMVEYAKENKFNFPYLYDESQKIGRALGATVTPEVFVLNKDRKIVYMGAVDDNMRPAKVKEKYLELAVEAALKGKKPEKTESRAFGCSIHYENAKP